MAYLPPTISPLAWTFCPSLVNVMVPPSTGTSSHVTLPLTALRPPHPVMRAKTNAHARNATARRAKLHVMLRYLYVIRGRSAA
jgi:hypothetical protein